MLPSVMSCRYLESLFLHLKQLLMVFLVGTTATITYVQQARLLYTIFP